MYTANELENVSSEELIRLLESVDDQLADNQAALLDAMTEDDDDDVNELNDRCGELWTQGYLVRDELNARGLNADFSSINLPINDRWQYDAVAQQVYY